jgi:hypothetical protein
MAIGFMPYYVIRTLMKRRNVMSDDYDDDTLSLEDIEDLGEKDVVKNDESWSDSYDDLDAEDWDGLYGDEEEELDGDPWDLN